MHDCDVTLRSLAWRRVSIAAVLVVCWTGSSGAEDATSGPVDVGGVEGSGMEQSSGAITNRSEVVVSVESLPGTPALRLAAIGEVVGSKMVALRACYFQVSRERPTTEGRLGIRVELRDGRTTVTLVEDGVGDRALTDCVLRELRSASFSAIRGSAGGVVVMEFSNSAAEGAAVVARERDQAPSAIVHEVDGRPQTRSRTPGGEVELVITGEAGVSPEGVAVLSRAVEARVGSILDCRRRASRGGLSPAGVITISLRVPVRGAASGRRLESTVAFPQAPQCVIRAVSQAAGSASGAAGTYHVEVRYTE